LEDSVKTTDEDVLLDKLITWYDNSETATEDSRLLSERDRDYYDHKQLTAEEISTLKARGQPVIQINRIKPKVDFLLGMERQMRSDPKAYPRTPKHEDDAEAATDSLRYVLENNDFDYTRSEVFENILVEGTGGVEILVQRKKKGVEIVINQYPWDRLFWDQHSRRRDFSDAKYKGAVVWMDLDDAKELGNVEAVEVALAEETASDTYDDAPRANWVDKGRKRIKLCSMWYQVKGEWHWAMFTKGGFVQGPMVSPFKDEDDEPECGLEMQSAFVDRDGNRYGAVRTLIDPQDEINKRRSKSLHLLTMRQTIGEQGAVDSVDQAKRELAKPDGHVEVQPGLRFEIASTNDLAQGQLALLQEAKNEIDTIGANAALQGKDDKNMSGRALMARQQSGQTELGPIFDSLRSWQKRVYRQVWNRIRQFWTEERWVRVTDDNKGLKFVSLNRPILAREEMEQQFGPTPPQYEGDPRLDIQVGMENNISELDVDIILEDAPDTITIQQEQFEVLAQIYQANPQAIPFEMIIEASQLRNKDQILEHLSGGATDEEKEQRRKQQQQEQQEAAQIMKQAKIVEIEKDKALAAKAQADAQVDQFKAETERMKATQPQIQTDNRDELALKRYEIELNARKELRMKEIDREIAVIESSQLISAPQE